MAIHHDHGKWNNNRPLFLKIGLALSIILAIIVFQTEINSKPIILEDYGPVELPQIITPPPTVQKKKKILPPKPPSKKKIIQEIKEIVEFIETDEPIEKKTDVIFEDAPIINDPIPEPAPPAPAPTPPTPPDDDIVHIRAERMPAFLNCLEISDEANRIACTEKTLLTHIYENLKYPRAALENNVEGVVVVSFVINKEGKLHDIEIIRDIGLGCGAAVVKVIDNLPPWIAGKQNGRPVNVMYRIPVHFKTR